MVNLSALMILWFLKKIDSELMQMNTSCSALTSICLFFFHFFWMMLSVVTSILNLMYTADSMISSVDFLGELSMVKVEFWGIIKQFCWGRSTIIHLCISFHSGWLLIVSAEYTFLNENTVFSMILSVSAVIFFLLWGDELIWAFSDDCLFDVCDILKLKRCNK